MLQFPPASVEVPGLQHSVGKVPSQLKMKIDIIWGHYIKISGNLTVQILNCAQKLVWEAMKD